MSALDYIFLYSGKSILYLEAVEYIRSKARGNVIVNNLASIFIGSTIGINYFSLDPFFSKDLYNFLDVPRLEHVT